MKIKLNDFDLDQQEFIKKEWLQGVYAGVIITSVMLSLYYFLFLK